LSSSIFQRIKFYEMLRKYFILIIFFSLPAILQAQIYLGDNGLTLSGTGVNKKVQLGGTLLQNTSFDLGSTFTFNIKKGTSNYLHILNNGNIGFGTNAPTVSFDVVGASRFRNSMTLNYGTANRTVQLTDAGLFLSRTSDGTYTNNITANTEMLFNTAGNYRFINNAVERFTILQAGNVGIGTNNPLAQLHSTGSVRLAGLLNDNAAPRVIASDINGNLSWRDASTLGGGSITANNGLIMTGNNIQLGGILTKSTVFTGSGFGTLFTDTISSFKPITVHHPSGNGINSFQIGLGAMNDSSSVYVGWNTGKTPTASNKINFFIGNGAGKNVTTAGGLMGIGTDALGTFTVGNFQANTAIGTSSMSSRTSGNGNTAIGYTSQLRAISGAGNTSIGVDAIRTNRTGGQNTAIGMSSMGYKAGGSGNTSIGSESMKGDNIPFINSDSIADNNTAVGYQSLLRIAEGDRNVAIGYQAGLQNRNGNDLLYINNDSSEAALIKGDFLADTLRINGKISIGSVDSVNTPQNILYITQSGRIQKAAIPTGGSSNWNLAGNNIVNTNTGFVSIGATPNPVPTDPQLKLAVNGNIYAQKLTITQQGWADYVFEPTYKLMPLCELEAYINKNKHLPDVPSATDVETKGLDLGENQTILLKKIEELTLYVLELKKEIDTLKLEQTNKPNKK
jgi:trimeric autotransporter adhesin